MRELIVNTPAIAVIALFIALVLWWLFTEWLFRPRKTAQHPASDQDAQANTAGAKLATSLATSQAMPNNGRLARAPRNSSVVANAISKDSTAKNTAKRHGVPASRARVHMGAVGQKRFNRSAFNPATQKSASPAATAPQPQHTPTPNQYAKKGHASETAPGQTDNTITSPHDLNSGPHNNPGQPSQSNSSSLQSVNPEANTSANRQSTSVGNNSTHGQLLSDQQQVRKTSREHQIANRAESASTSKQDEKKAGSARGNVPTHSTTARGVTAPHQPPLMPNTHQSGHNPATAGGSQGNPVRSTDRELRSASAGRGNASNKIVASGERVFTRATGDSRHSGIDTSKDDSRNTARQPQGKESLQTPASAISRTGLDDAIPAARRSVNLSQHPDVIKADATTHNPTETGIPTLPGTADIVTPKNNRHPHKTIPATTGKTEHNAGGLPVSHENSKSDASPKYQTAAKARLIPPSIEAQTQVKIPATSAETSKDQLIKALKAQIVALKNSQDSATSSPVSRVADSRATETSQATPQQLEAKPANTAEQRSADIINDTENENFEKKYQAAAERLSISEKKLERLQSTLTSMQVAGISETDHKPVRTTNKRATLLSKVRILDAQSAKIDQVG